MVTDYFRLLSPLLKIVRPKGIDAILHTLIRLGGVTKSASYYAGTSVEREREKLARELETLGARVFQSSTNFLLFRSEIPALAEELGDRGIFVMDASGQLGAGFVRLTVGKPEENDEFIRTYRTIKNQTAGREIRYE